MKDFIKRLMNDEYSTLEQDVEDLTARKIVERIKEKKEEVIQNLNSKKKTKET